MLRIGLTGGIGSGKTAASDRFVQLGIDVIDTDRLSRELVEPGQPALAEIARAFGPGVLDTDGRLDRAHLRGLVFDHPEARQRLEQILHPRIRETMLARGLAARSDYVVYVIPLLFETEQQDLVDRVLLIDVPVALQRSRTARRDGMTETEVARILATQTDRATRQRLADDIICNDGTLEQLHQAVDAYHQRFLCMAQDSAR